MKRFLFIFFILFIMPFSQNAFAATDFEVLYAQTEVANFRFMHDVDPFQDEDTYKYAWSPYLLFRTSSTCRFKDTIIEPGYYLLTPRKYNDKFWILFKQNGRVMHTIPVLKTEVVPPGYYKSNVPTPKRTKLQKAGRSTSQFFYRIFQGSKKQNPPSAFVEFERYMGHLYILKYYYGQTVYITALRVD